MEDMMQKLEDMRKIVKTALEYTAGEFATRKGGGKMTVVDFGCNSWPDENYAMFNFHIKECPGFLFSVWISDESLTFFAQYEKTIDKFKPSYSHLKVETKRFEKDTVPEDIFYDLLSYDWAEMVLYIKRYPILAWHKDNYFDREFIYVSPIKAFFQKMKKDIYTATHTFFSDIQTKCSIKKIRRFFNAERKHDELHYTKITLFDRGEDFSPRYEYCLVYPTHQEISEDGWVDFPKNRSIATYNLPIEIKGDISDCVQICTKEFYDRYTKSEYQTEGYKSFPPFVYWDGKEDTEALKEQRIAQLEHQQRVKENEK